MKNNGVYVNPKTHVAHDPARRHKNGNRCAMLQYASKFEWHPSAPAGTRACGRCP
jgi:hypothetical protein